MYHEDLQTANMLKNHHLAKSMSDASWGLFLGWLRYYGQMHGIPIIAVPARFTTQECSGCGERVQKSLSVRTHICPHCGLVLDRDENAAINILHAALCTWGHQGTGTLRSTQRLGRSRPLSAARKGTGKSVSVNQESHPL